MKLFNNKNVKFIFLLLIIHQCLKLEKTTFSNSNLENEECKLIKEDSKLNTENFIKKIEQNHKQINSNKWTEKKSDNKTNKLYGKRQEDIGYVGEYMTIKRDIKFFISRSSECNVSINEDIVYKKVADINFVEHWILHNNVNSIEPKSVTSEDVKIKFFYFNKTMNIFSVYFEDSGDATTNQFLISFLYDAVDLIKTYDYYPIDKDKDTFFLESNLNSNSTSQIYNYNEILWKFFNINYYSITENLNIELVFDIGSDFPKYFIYSLNTYFHFTKKVTHSDKKKTLVHYLWAGPIESQEVLIMDIKMPLYFENCKCYRMDMLMIAVGSFFIAFVIIMLYIIFSSVIFNDI